MKKLTLTWLCLTLTTAFALAADYHLFQAQMLDGEVTESGDLAEQFPTIWVLIRPDDPRPVVFQKFDSQQMEAWLTSLLARGSVLHVHGSAMLVDTNSSAQWDAFKAFCQKQGIKYVDDTPPD